MSNLNGIKGLGAKRVELLQAYGINDRDDLMDFIPIDYYNLNRLAVAQGEQSHIAILGRVVKPPMVRFVRKGLSVSRLQCMDPNGLPFSVVYYNRPYLKSQVSEGALLYFFGDMDDKMVMLNPLSERADAVVPHGFYTVYPQIKGIPRAVLKEAVLDCVTQTSVSSVLNGLSGFTPTEVASAYKELHIPTSEASIAEAQHIVAIEELTQLTLMFKLKKNNAARIRAQQYLDHTSALQTQLKALPFQLTEDQTSVIDSILTDLKSDRLMNRLIQGDVGSGKTIVAFAAMRYVSMSGSQAALMAPTEILARQHFEGYKRFFGEEGVISLYSGMPLKKRVEALKKIADGSALIVIGTHSLIQPNVRFQKLSLVVTDEQHRFGVSQRAAIEDKSAQADVLIMSATPIPRTMALLLYGDLDVSILKKKPFGQSDIETKMVPIGKKEDMFLFLKKEALEDRRSYIVVPRVEADDDAVNAKSLYRDLTAGVFKEVPVGLLYGAMKEKDKADVMQRFSNGELKILIATTVIEVGVDVRQACNMVILDADRFGLSQLHQLRGRVGRGAQKSYCFLVRDKLTHTDNKDRLKLLTECNDGFLLADYDLEMRGAGDFIGVCQHGYAGAIANLPLHKQEIETARLLAESLLATCEPSELPLKEKYLALVQNVTLN